MPLRTRRERSDEHVQSMPGTAHLGEYRVVDATYQPARRGTRKHLAVIVKAMVEVPTGETIAEHDPEPVTRSGHDVSVRRPCGRVGAAGRSPIRHHRTLAYASRPTVQAPEHGRYLRPGAAVVPLPARRRAEFTRPARIFRGFEELAALQTSVRINHNPNDTMITAICQTNFVTPSKPPRIPREGQGRKPTKNKQGQPKTDPMADETARKDESQPSRRFLGGIQALALRGALAGRGRVWPPVVLFCCFLVFCVTICGLLVWVVGLLCVWFVLVFVCCPVCCCSEGAWVRCCRIGMGCRLC